MLPSPKFVVGGEGKGVVPHVRSVIFEDYDMRKTTPALSKSQGLGYF